MCMYMCVRDHVQRCMCASVTAGQVSRWRSEGSSETFRCNFTVLSYAVTCSVRESRHRPSPPPSHSLSLSTALRVSPRLCNTLRVSPSVILYHFLSASSPSRLPLLSSSRRAFLLSLATADSAVSVTDITVNSCIPTGWDTRHRFIGDLPSILTELDFDQRALRVRPTIPRF